jgi:hypothetical protein
MCILIIEPISIQKIILPEFCTQIMLGEVRGQVTTNDFMQCAVFKVSYQMPDSGCWVSERWKGELGDKENCGQGEVWKVELGIMISKIYQSLIIAALLERYQRFYNYEKN